MLNRTVVLQTKLCQPRAYTSFTSNANMLKITFKRKACFQQQLSATGLVKAETMTQNKFSIKSFECKNCFVSLRINQCFFQKNILTMANSIFFAE